MFKLLEITRDDLIAIQIDGEIRVEDYEKINPLIDKAVREYGKIKLFIRVGQVGSMTPEALVRDIKMYINHYNHFKKVAVTGDSNWEKFLTGIAGPFISGRVKYFPEARIAEAIQWIQE